jgi:hypothetical protein
MAPRNLSKKQAEQAVAEEDVESEQETLDPKTISKDMEKNVGTARIELDINRGDLTQDAPPSLMTSHSADARSQDPEAQPASCEISARNVSP